METGTTEPRLSTYLHARACRNGTPLVGNFELTARCNFNCKMCYVHLPAEEQRVMHGFTGWYLDETGETE